MIGCNASFHRQTKRNKEKEKKNKDKLGTTWNGENTCVKATVDAKC